MKKNINDLTQRELGIIERDYFEYVEKETEKRVDEKLDKERINIMKGYSFMEWYENDYEEKTEHHHTHDIVKYRLLETIIAKENFPKDKDNWQEEYKWQCYYSYIERHTQDIKETFNITDERILDYIRLHNMKYCNFKHYLDYELERDLKDIDDEKIYGNIKWCPDREEKYKFLINFNYEDYKNYESFNPYINSDVQDFEYPKKPTDTLNVEKYKLLYYECYKSRKYIESIKEIDWQLTNWEKINFENHKEKGLNIDEGLKKWLTEINN